MRRDEFKRRVNVVTARTAAQNATVALQQAGLISIVKGRSFRDFTPVEMAWILFLSAQPGGNVCHAIRIAEENREIIPAIALAIEAGISVEVRWWTGYGIRHQLSFPANIICYLTNRLNTARREAA